MLRRWFRLVRGCEDEIGVMILDNEVRATGEVGTVLLEVEAVMDVERKIGSAGGPLSHSRDRFRVCTKAKRSPAAQKPGSGLQKSESSGESFGSFNISMPTMLVTF